MEIGENWWKNNGRKKMVLKLSTFIIEFES